MPKTPDGRLTKRQREFCEEYIKDYNLTKAYGRVYTSAAEKNWASLASKLFSDARIKEYVRQLEEQVFLEKGINAEHIAVELAKIAFEDPDASRADKMKAIEQWNSAPTDNIFLGLIEFPVGIITFVGALAIEIISSVLCVISGVSIDDL